MAGVRKRAGRNLAPFVRQLRKEVGLTFAKKFTDEFFRDRQRFLITGVIKRRLYNYGIDGGGNKLAPYAKRTILEKKKRGLRTNPTTLKFSGAWYDSMYVRNEVYTGGVSIEVRTRGQEEKTAYLKNKYSGRILTLTTAEERVLIKEFQDHIMEQFNYDLSTLEFKIT